MTTSPLLPARLALFGGTFDPVHDGHIAVAAAAVARCQLDRVIFLPARLSPHKTGRAPGASPADRLEMLRLATAGCPWAEVSDWEISQSPPSFTWKTARHFLGLYPDSRLFWLLGADQWEVIESWARPEILRESFEFLVFSRPPHPPPEPRPGWRSQTLDDVHPASATAIRESLEAGMPCPPHLCESVAAHIRARGLYQRDDHAL